MATAALHPQRSCSEGTGRGNARPAPGWMRRRAPPGVQSWRTRAENSEKCAWSAVSSKSASSSSSSCSSSCRSHAPVSHRAGGRLLAHLIASRSLLRRGRSHCRVPLLRVAVRFVLNDELALEKGICIQPPASMQACGEASLTACDERTHPGLASAGNDSPASAQGRVRGARRQHGHTRLAWWVERVEGVRPCQLTAKGAHCARLVHSPALCKASLAAWPPPSAALRRACGETKRKRVRWKAAGVASSGAYTWLAPSGQVALGALLADARHLQQELERRGRQLAAQALRRGQVVRM